MQIIGIAGPSGAGKTLFTEKLMERLRRHLPGNPIQSISEDCYYHRQSHLALSDRHRLNYDHPDAFEHELLIRHLRQLQQGEPVECPGYDYEIHDRRQESVTVFPGPIIIVEGILLFHRPELRERFDLRLFIHAPLDVCLVRRLRRDVEQRGRDMESILRQYEATVRPMYHQFIRPTMDFADLIIPNGGENSEAIRTLENHLIQAIR